MMEEMVDREVKVIKLKKIFLITKYLGDQIDLKKAQAYFKHYKLLTYSHPLVIKLADLQYVVLTKFGTATFWNVKEGDIRKFLEELAPFVRIYQLDNHYNYADNLVVYTGARFNKVTFEEIYLKRLDIEKIKIISYVSAQSVALERYEEEIDKRLTELGKIAETLKSSHRPRFKEKELLRQVGYALSVKQNAVSNLSLFDKPEEAWEREEIERLYNHLYVAYEIPDRFDVLNEKIKFISENNITLLNFISSAKSNFLELVIIGLIFFEIVILMLEIFKIMP